MAVYTTRGAGGAQNGAQSAPGKYLAPPGIGPGRRSASGQMYTGLSKLDFTGYEHFSAILTARARTGSNKQADLNAIRA
jgi:hypothetical protein